MSNEWLNDWYAIGMRNPWIAEAYDPPFNRDGFGGECTDAENLAYRIAGTSSWVMGAVFYWKDQCWINQSEGGAEFLVIKENVPFESISTGRMSEEKVLAFIKAIDAATVEECRKLEYATGMEL